MMLRSAGWVLLGLGALSQAASSQVRIGEPQARFSEAFSVVQTVRSLPDGRVLIADPLSQVLVALDLDAGAADTLGRVGEGPREYRQPDAVWPLPGGRSLLVDLGNGRLTELGADLSFGDTRPYTVGDFGPGRELVLAIPQGVDDQGRIYFRSFGRPGAGMVADSAYILRLDPATEKVDSLGQFKLTDRTEQTSGGPNNRNTQISPIPLSPADAWGVAPDGRVAVARAGTFRVDWIAPDGTISQGPEVDYSPVRIRQAEKEEWQQTQGEAGGGMRIGVTVNNGTMTMAATRGGDSGDDDLDQYEWPDEKPPFYQGRVPIDPSGRAWIRRHGVAGSAPRYDVFGASGAREMTVELTQGRRVVGFGEGVLYAVHTDELGLQYVERYALP